MLRRDVLGDKFARLFSLERNNMKVSKIGFWEGGCLEVALALD